MSEEKAEKYISGELKQGAEESNIRPCHKGLGSSTSRGGGVATKTMFLQIYPAGLVFVEALRSTAQLKRCSGCCCCRYDCCKTSMAIGSTPNLLRPGLMDDDIIVGADLGIALGKETERGNKLLSDDITYTHVVCLERRACWNIQHAVFLAVRSRCIAEYSYQQLGSTNT